MINGTRKSFCIEVSQKVGYDFIVQHTHRLLQYTKTVKIGAIHLKTGNVVKK